MGRIFARYQQAPTNGHPGGSAAPVDVVDKTAARDAERRTAYAEFSTLWSSPPAPTVFQGPKETEDYLVVVICLWNRPQRIQKILEILNEQTGLGNRNIRLLLWNNNPEDHGQYLEAVRRFDMDGALQCVELTMSPHNVRGAARFIVARQCVANGYRGPLVTLDDDQDLQPDAFSALLQTYDDRGGQRVIAGTWAWRSDADDFWQRDRARQGEPANYVGTGGAVIDSAIFADDALFEAFPERGMFMEDMWLSRFAVAQGWDLRGAELDFTFVLDDTNQAHGLVMDKVDFWRSLAADYPIPFTYQRTTAAP